MTTQDADGPELAQALDSLTDALSRAVRHAQQEESAFQMAPVELVLKVMVSWAEPGAGGAEWRVLGPGTTAAHSLTMRFTPREARRDSAGPAGGAGRAGESSGGSPSSDPRSRRRASSAPAGARPGGWRTVLPTATSLPATAVPSTAVPGAGPIGPVSGLAEGRRGPDWAGGSVPPVRHGGPYAVRVSVYLDEAAGERPRLLVERAAVPVPEQETAEFARAADQPGAGPQGRKPLVDAIGEYVADRVDRAAFKPVKQQWEIRGYWNPAAASDQLDGLQKWLLHLVQQPQEDTAAGLGVPSAAAEVAGGIGANIVIAPVNRAVEGLTKIVDIVGIVAGTTLGLHPIALLCLKHLVHTEFHDMVVKAVTKAFDGLVVGTKEVPPPSAGGPARHPSPPTPPPRPAPGPPPSAPPSPPPGRPPSAPPSPGPWRQGGSGIRGPGGF